LCASRCSRALYRPRLFVVKGPTLRPSADGEARTDTGSAPSTGTRHSRQARLLLFLQRAGLAGTSWRRGRAGRSRREGEEARSPGRRIRRPAAAPIARRRGRGEREGARTVSIAQRRGEREGADGCLVLRHRRSRRKTAVAPIDRSPPSCRDGRNIFRNADGGASEHAIADLCGRWG
jgi:hypothetical protein